MTLSNDGNMDIHHSNSEEKRTDTLSFVLHRQLSPRRYVDKTVVTIGTKRIVGHPLEIDKQLTVEITGLNSAGEQVTVKSLYSTLGSEIPSSVVSFPRTVRITLNVEQVKETANGL